MATTDSESATPPPTPGPSSPPTPCGGSSRNVNDQSFAVKADYFSSFPSLSLFLFHSFSFFSLFIWILHLFVRQLYLYFAMIIDVVVVVVVTFNYFQLHHKVSDSKMASSKVSSRQTKERIYLIILSSKVFKKRFMFMLEKWASDSSSVTR